MCRDRGLSRNEVRKVKGHRPLHTQVHQLVRRVERRLRRFSRIAMGSAYADAATFMTDFMMIA